VRLAAGPKQGFRDLSALITNLNLDLGPMGARDVEFEGLLDGLFDKVLLSADPSHGPALARRVAHVERVAVCLSGQLRTFLDDDVQAGFAEYFHRPGYEYFISTDEDVDLSKSSIGRYVQSVTVNNTGPDHELMKKCPTGTLMHRFLLPMVSRYVACHNEITALEHKKGIRYDYVLRARPDHLFLDAFPSAADLLERFAPGRDVLLLDDHIAVARRQKMGTILLTPLRAYGECHDVAEWSVACNKTITHLHDKKSPCCPMRMVAKYEENSAAVAGYEFTTNLFGSCTLALKVKNRDNRCFFR